VGKAGELMVDAWIGILKDTGIAVADDGVYSGFAIPCGAGITACDAVTNAILKSATASFFIIFSNR
jgi:hypothetical protein